MEFNFYFWLDAFTKYMNGQSDTPLWRHCKLLMQSRHKNHFYRDYMR